MPEFKLIGFFLPFLLTMIATPLVRNFAVSKNILDFPDQDRKIQKKPIPKLGGWAVFVGFSVSLLGWLIFRPESFGNFIEYKYLVGILLSSLLLVIGGYLDDKYSLPPGNQIFFTVGAVLILILSGVQLSYINNPLGGALLLDNIKFFGYPLMGGLFVFVWILGMTYTTKFLDGMDGLVSGIAGIGALILYFLSLLPEVSQPDTALLCLMVAGAFLGFLPWNFHPAKIFLGESGSTLAGFLIGTLAVISGGKVATALLIMGIPILDAAWVITRRLLARYSPFQGDRRHLHFRLLDIGFSQRQTVIFLYILSAAFGVSGLYLASVAKLIALFILLGVMLVLGFTVFTIYQARHGSDK